MKNNRYAFQVSVDLPDGVTIEEMRQYIEEAVSTWCGSFDAQNDPLFDLNRHTIAVSVHTRAKSPKPDPKPEG